MRHKKIVIFLVLLMAAGVYLLEERLVINRGESISGTFYWKINSAPRLGDYVNFNLKHPYLGDKPVNVTKKLACVENQMLTISGTIFNCDGKTVAYAKGKTLDGRELIPFKYNARILQGEGFVLGEHPDSFDSRYWGLVDLNIVQTVVPIGELL